MRPSPQLTRPARDRRRAKDGAAAPAAGPPAAAPQRDEADRARLRSLALARWENEGGADGPAPDDAPPLDSVEAVQLRVRVIALENLVVSLLAETPVRQRALARAMAAFISPRPGCAAHPLTLRAAGEMRSLIDRAERFSGTDAP